MFKGKKIIYQLFIIGCLSFILLPLFARKVQKGNSSLPVSELSKNDQKRYQYFFLEAMRQQNAGRYDAAFSLLQHAIDINPNAAEAYYYQSMYYSQLKNDSLALASLEKASDLNPDNSTYLERIAQYYIGNRNYDLAIEKYEELSRKNPESAEYLQLLAQLYQQQKKYDMMIQTINRLETLQGSSEQFSLAKMRVYEMMNDKKSAYRELKTLVEKHPLDANYKIMLGNWLMQNGREKEAYKNFMTVLQDEPNNAYAQSSLYDYYTAVHEDSLAEKLMLNILVSPKMDNETKASMLRSAIQKNEQESGDSTKIFHLFDLALSVPQTNGDLAELKAAYMSLKKMPEDSLNKALEKVLEIAPDNAGARIQIIQSYWAKKDFDKVISLSQTGIAYRPDEMAFYYFLGLSYFQQDKNDNALDAFRRGVSQINSQSNANIVSDFYAIMGDILHQKGLADEAFAAYDSCLQWKSDNYGCLNNYAYYLSVENRNLQKAEQMSYKTIKAEPNNVTFLDTYAWILFMEQRYSEAKIYIDQAIKTDSDSIQSAVILEHAGDIYSMNQLQEEAVKFWKKSLHAGNDSKALPRKIKQKKYIKE